MEMPKDPGRRISKKGGYMFSVGDYIVKAGEGVGIY